MIVTSIYQLSMQRGNAKETQRGEQANHVRDNPDKTVTREH